ncbi:MAG TPA: hypothetical protein VFU73_06050 [Actinocrinis sp.]|nr:hypothetical protein [Actinocrinis sp.]
MTATRRLAAGCSAVVLAASLSACRHPLRSEGTSVTPPAVGGAPASASATPAPSGTGGPVSQQDVQQLQGIVSGANSAAAAARSAMAGDSATPPG